MENIHIKSTLCFTYTHTWPTCSNGAEINHQQCQFLQNSLNLYTSSGCLNQAKKFWLFARPFNDFYTIFLSHIFENFYTFQLNNMKPSFVGNSMIDWKFLLTILHKIQSFILEVCNRPSIFTKSVSFKMFFIFIDQKSHRKPKSSVTS